MGHGVFEAVGLRKKQKGGGEWGGLDLDEGSVSVRIIVSKREGQKRRGFAAPLPTAHTYAPPAGGRTMYGWE